MNFIKFIRVFFLALIVLGIGLLITQKMWVPKVVGMILKTEVVEFKNPISEENNKVVEEKIPPKEIDELPGCVAAFAEISPDLSDIHIGIKYDLSHYRQSWQDVCLGKKERSLYPLWVEAKELMRAKNSDFTTSALCKIGQNGECFDITYFTPGINILTAEGMIQDFIPSQKLFAENVKLGTQEDKDFFTTYTSLNIDDSNNFSPWIEQTWDYGGCMKYGSYDWVGALKKLDELSKKVNSPQYIEDINVSRNLIVYYNSSNDYAVEICTCGKKEAVLDDLEKILEYANKEVFYKETVSSIGNFMEKIKSGGINVLSEAERHCSGG